MTPYRFTSAALKELRRATFYYEQRENGLGATFLDEVDATFTEFSNIPPPGIRYLHGHDAAELIAFRLV